MMKNSQHKRCIAVLYLTAALVIAASGSVMAFDAYTPGVLGIKAATLPPTGFHYTMFNVFYQSDSMLNADGDELPIGFDLNVYAMANRFTYMTEKTFLGARYGFNVIIPFINTDIKIDAMGVNESTFGLGDVCVEPILLTWNTPRWDVTIAAGAYAPTGEDDDPSSPGKGYWSFMETLGATYYFDDAKTLSISALTRWIQNTEDDDTKITDGASMVAEYGIAKSFPISKDLILTAGLVGYSYAQLSDDSGTGASDDNFKGNAFGPELHIIFFKPFPIQISLRHQFEYGVESGTEGTNTCLTLIGSF